MNHSSIVAVLFFSLWFSGCEREKPTFVEVSNGPSFALSGSGQLAVFTVYAPRAGEKIAFPQPDVAAAVWKIQSSGGYFDGKNVEGLRLFYGQVPEGYTQSMPPSRPPPTLPKGAVYSYFAETANAPVAAGYFYLGDSGVTPVKVPDLCLELINGHQTRVKCNDPKQPYKEPAHIEDFVQQHRITE